MDAKNHSRHKSSQPQASSDFDLDEYLEEKSHQQPQTSELEEADTISYRIKNFVLLASVALLGVLWYFDWSPWAMYKTFWGEKEIVIGTPAPGEIEIEIPDIEIPIPDFDYPLDAEFPTTENATLPPVTQYLQELQNMGILGNELSVFEARELYNSNIPLDYVKELQEYGFLEDLSFVHITEFYNSRIPMSYLDQLKEVGYLNRFSFVDITEYYKNKVSFEYLNQLDKAGYLDELSFVHITEYYKNGITVEFLDELKKTGLYDQLSFVDVVEIFKDQN